jgi:hypothetical protein
VCDRLNVEANKTPKIQMTRGVEERSDRVKPGRQVVQYYRVRRKALFFAGRFFLAVKSIVKDADEGALDLRCVGR